MPHGGDSDLGAVAEPYELDPIVFGRVQLRPAPPQDVYASAAPVRLASPVPVSVLRSRKAPEPPVSDVAFRRWLFAPMADCLARLAEWAGGSAMQGVGHSRLVLEPPLSHGPGGHHLSVLLHRRFRAPVPMELAIEESSAPFGTQLTLRPIDEVRPGRRYFREGNTVLNCVEDVLEDDAPGTGHT